MIDMKEIYTFELIRDEWQRDRDLDPIFKIQIFRIRSQPKMDRIHNPVKYEIPYETITDTRTRNKINCKLSSRLLKKGATHEQGGRS